MVISVLIPARGRPDYLQQSIGSLLCLADKPKNVELLIRTDNDDSSLFDYHLRNPERLLDKVVCGHRHGYQGLHHYYNELARLSTGDFLMLWNDDTEMLTKGWDALLCDGPLFSVQNPRRDTVKTTDFTFPVLGRPIYEAMGHFALNPYNDAYVAHVAFYSGTSVIRDDISFHHHCLTDAQVAEHGSAGIDRFHDPAEVAMRQADINKIMAAPGYARRFDAFDIALKDYDFKLKYAYTPPDAKAAMCRKK